MNPMVDTFDSQVWDDPEPGGIVYEVAKRPGAPDSAARLVSENTSFPIAIAKRFSTSTRDVMAGVAGYGQADAVWLLPADALPPGLVPKKGDVVIDAAQTRWTTQDLKLRPSGSVWRLNGRNLILAQDLRDTITIERATLTNDAAGVKVKAYPTRAGNDTTSPLGGRVLYGALAAKVQKLESAPADRAGIRGPLVKFDVIVGRQVDVDSELDRIRLADGTYLDITRIRDVDLYDRLPTIEAVKRP